MFSSLKEFLEKETRHDDCYCFLFWDTKKESLKRIDFEKEQILSAMDQIENEFLKPDVVEAHGPVTNSVIDVLKNYGERFSNHDFDNDDHFRFAASLALHLRLYDPENFPEILYFTVLRNDTKMLIMGYVSIEVLDEEMSRVLDFDTITKPTLH